MCLLGVACVSCLRAILFVSGKVWHLQLPVEMASIKRQEEEEEEYLAPRAVYQARFVEKAGYVDIKTNTHPHTLRKSFCPQALQGLHDYRCPSPKAHSLTIF